MWCSGFSFSIHIHKNIYFTAQQCSTVVYSREKFMIAMEMYIHKIPFYVVNSFFHPRIRAFSYREEIYNHFLFSYFQWRVFAVVIVNCKCWAALTSQNILWFKIALAFIKKYFLLWSPMRRFLGMGTCRYI